MLNSILEPETERQQNPSIRREMWWIPVPFCIAFTISEYFFGQVSQAHGISMQLTLLCYLLAITINANCAEPIHLPDLIKHNLNSGLSLAWVATWVMVILISATKLAYLHWNPEGHFWETGSLDSTYLAYLWMVPLQELTARGIFQLQIARLIKHPKAELYSVIITAFVFAMLHLVHSIAFTLVAFMFGIVCGLMFMRTHNLVGISLFHIIVGNFSGITGVWDLLAKSPW